MSHSPSVAAKEAGSEHVTRYRNGWSALSQLIGMGRSFSGHERNCCFLNHPSGQFIDISAATGLDLDDDGRSVALADWDGDGDVDFWLANRTAPRIRLMRNDLRSDNHWVALRLEGGHDRGGSANRDAIGARVEITLPNGETLTRTLHAGDGYLSQSSKWITVGLGKADKLKQVVVAWPGGNRETIRGIEAVDSHYVILEGNRTATAWIRPGNGQPGTAWIATATQPPKPNNNTRTWIQGQAPLPFANYEADAATTTLDKFRGRPLLVNLWSKKCNSCPRELETWASHATEFQDADLQILALCVDGDSGSDFLQDLKFPFSTGQPSDELLRGMEALQRTFLELQQPLPVPTSFLLNAQGGVAAIYKGPVEVGTVLDDVKTLSKSRATQRDAAVPFPGRWASQVFPIDPRPIVRSLDLAKQENAGQYYHRYADYVTNVSRMPADVSAAAAYKLQGDRYLNRGDRAAAVEAFAHVLRLQGDEVGLQRAIAQQLLIHGAPEAALKHYRQVLKLSPQDFNSLTNAGLACMSMRKTAEAAKFFRMAIRLNETDADLHFHLANALQTEGETPHCVQAYRRCLELKPTFYLAANNLAWILATHPNPKFRNGSDAVILAEQCCAAVQAPSAEMTATLAVALAEARRFRDARNKNKQAIALAREQKNASLVARLLERQQLFDADRPFRDQTISKKSENDS